MKRICKKCKIEKEITCFVKANNCKFGYRFICKICFNLKLNKGIGSGKNSNSSWFKKGHGYIGGGVEKGRHLSPFTEFKKGIISYNFKGGYKNTLFLNRQRKVFKKANGGSHTFEEWTELKKKFNFMCLCCKREEPEIKLTEDHIIPISKGGNNNIENIQPLCQSCNSIKGIKIINYFNILTF